MSDELKVFRELILWLWESHKKPWEYDSEDVSLQLLGNGLQASSFYEDNELEAYLPSEEKVDSIFPNNRYLYLSPITENRIMVPRLQLKCDFGRNIPEVRCRLELFLVSDDAEIQSLGYRFESPEGQNDQGTGVHHYYHIQIIQPPPPTLPIYWLPETQPAFPLNADEPVKMLLGLLVSLYGLDYLGTLLRDSSIWKLDEYVNQLPCMKFESFIWYRLVEIGDPVKHRIGYSISSNIAGFETYIRALYPGCKIRGITRAAFEAMPDKDSYPKTVV